MLITNNGDHQQTRITQLVIQNNGHQLITLDRVPNLMVTIEQISTLDDLKRYQQDLHNLLQRQNRIIVWFHRFAEDLVDVESLQDAVIIVVPSQQAKDFLIKRGIASERLVVNEFDDFPLQWHWNYEPHNQATVQSAVSNVPQLIAIQQLNQHGGWGKSSSESPYYLSDQLLNFLMAGLPVIVPAGSAAANVVQKYQNGLIVGKNENVGTVLQQVSTERYQQLVDHANHLANRLRTGFYTQHSYYQAQTMAAIGQQHQLAKHPRYGIQVMDSFQTLDYIDRHHPSVARLGDGEISLIMGAPQVFQDLDPTLQARLDEIIKAGSNQRLLVCLSDAFHDLDRYVPRAKAWWEGHLNVFHNYYTELGKYHNVYGNTMVTRPYMDLANRNEAGEIFRRIKEWWQGRDLLIVEGQYTRSGVGNDLYDNAKSIQRIICPSKNAWEKYRDIEELIKQHGQGKLVLVMLGMTATVIAADLADWGQVIDSGHLDPEYEWYKMGAIDRVKLTGKHTAEMNYDQGIQEIHDPIYENQIIADLS